MNIFGFTLVNIEPNIYYFLACSDKKALDILIKVKTRKAKVKSEK